LSRNDHKLCADGSVIFTVFLIVGYDVQDGTEGYLVFSADFPDLLTNPSR